MLTRTMLKDEHKYSYKKGDLIAGKILIHSILGRGGFGEVYLASDPDVNQFVAIKTIKQDLLTNPSLKSVFQNELDMWLKMKPHSCVVNLVSAEEIHSRIFISMEYIAPDYLGRVTLYDHLDKARGPLKENQSLIWAISFCHGMEHANTHGIKCHRDIKPENIFVTHDSGIKISDFGLAVAFDMLPGEYQQTIETKVNRSTFSIMESDGLVIAGTPGYVAPEVYRSERADVRSDIYSFGIVLWQMACGSSSPPFRHLYEKYETERYLREAYALQMAEQIPWLDTIFWNVIERCLRADPKLRYADFGELRRDLENILHDYYEITVKIPVMNYDAPWYWNNRGASFFALKNYEDAIACFDKVLDMDPLHFECLVNKGVCLSELNRHKEALELFRKALELQPSNIEIIFKMGNTYDDLNKFAEAVECLDRILEVDPSHIGALLHKGIYLAKQGNREEANKHWDRVLELDPQETGALYNKGASLFGNDRYKEAIECFEKVLEIEPLHNESWDYMGTSFLFDHQPEKALVCYDKVLEISPGCTGTWRNKANVFNILNRHEEATRCYNEALNMDPSDPVTWFDLGIHYSRLNRLMEAIQCYDKVLEIDPSNAATWYNRGLALAFFGRIDEALNCFNKATENDPKNPEAWNNKGICLETLGHIKDAMNCYITALEIDPANLGALFNRALAEEKSGMRSSAVSSFRKFLESVPPECEEQIEYTKQRLAELERK